MFNNLSSYYLQLHANVYMLPCSQNLISLHILNTLRSSKVLCQNGWPCVTRLVWERPVPHTYQWLGSISQSCWRVLQWESGQRMSVRGGRESGRNRDFILLQHLEGSWAWVSGKGNKTLHLSDTHFQGYKIWVLYLMRNLPEHLFFFLTAGRGMEGVTSQLTISW